MQYSTKNVILGVSLSLSFILFLIVAGSTFQFVNLVNADQISQRIVETANDVNVTLINAETGERGYIITGDKEYLSPYNTSLLIINGQLDQLRRYTNQQTQTHPDIDSIIRLSLDKMNSLAGGIKLREEQGFEAVKAQFVGNHGKGEMDEVRALVAGIGFQEIVRADQLNDSLKTYAFVMAASIVLLLASVFADIILFNNYYKNKNYGTNTIDT